MDSDVQIQILLSFEFVFSSCFKLFMLYSGLFVISIEYWVYFLNLRNLVHILQMYSEFLFVVQIFCGTWDFELYQNAVGCLSGRWCIWVYWLLVFIGVILYGSGILSGITYFEVQLSLCSDQVSMINLWKNKLENLGDYTSADLSLQHLQDKCYTSSILNTNRAAIVPVEQGKDGMCELFPVKYS